MKGITRCKLTIISESADSLDRFGPTWPVYRFLIVIHQKAMLLFKCFCFCFYHRYERIFLSFIWFILMNAQMSTQLLKNPSNLWLFGQDQSVSKKFPMLASPRLYLDIFFQIYGLNLVFKTEAVLLSTPKKQLQLFPIFFSQIFFSPFRKQTFLIDF